MYEQQGLKTVHVSAVTTSRVHMNNVGGKLWNASTAAKHCWRHSSVSGWAPNPIHNLCQCLCLCL